MSITQIVDEIIEQDHVSVAEAIARAVRIKAESVAATERYAHGGQS